MRHLARLTGGLRHLLCHHVGDEKVPEGRRVTRPERLVSTAFASKRGTKVYARWVKGSRLGRILCHPCDGLRIQKLTIGRRLPMNGLSLQPARRRRHHPPDRSTNPRKCLPRF